MLASSTKCMKARDYWTSAGKPFVSVNATPKQDGHGVESLGEA
jgi:hypothetical protein